jgi:hypothetical protein
MLENPAIVYATGSFAKRRSNAINRIDGQVVKTETKTQLAVFLENRPGTLASVCDALAAAKINIIALTISDTVDHAVVRMVLSDPRKALSIFEERGTLVVENEVLVLEHGNKPGVLSAIAKKLASKKINIDYAYLGSAPSSQRGILIFRPDNLNKALKVLAEE